MDTAGYVPALTAQQFIDGENSLPKLVPFLELQAASSTSKGFSATTVSIYHVSRAMYHASQTREYSVNNRTCSVLKIFRFVTLKCLKEDGLNDEVNYFPS